MAKKNTKCPRCPEGMLEPDDYTSGATKFKGKFCDTCTYAEVL